MSREGRRRFFQLTENEGGWRWYASLEELSEIIFDYPFLFGNLHLIENLLQEEKITRLLWRSGTFDLHRFIP
jgi:hypothetical protein